MFAVNLTTENFVIINDQRVNLTLQEQKRIIVSISLAIITILDNDGVSVNDTVIGDPFFAVPVYMTNEQLQVLQTQRVSICYEVHGEENRWFNLVTDRCTSVNARFVFLSSSLTVIDEVGVRTVDSSNQCVNIRVNVHQCTAEVNGVSLDLNQRYSSGGIMIRRLKNRVRISVPNCNALTLVMWAICEINLPNQPGEMIKFVVTRGLNFQGRRAHGLFGKCTCHV